MDPNSKVHQLINWEMKWWDHGKLVNLFTKEEVAAIKKIPISHTNQPDYQIWRCMSSGIFLVKSAYHLAKELEDRKTPESSNQNITYHIIYFTYIAINSQNPLIQIQMKKLIYFINIKYLIFIFILLYINEGG